MFETTVVESKKHKVGIQRFMTLPVSIALHAIVIAAVVIGAIWNVSFPTHSPAQVAQYSMAAAPPPTAPAPLRAPSAAKQTQTMTPVEAPHHDHDLAASVAH